MNSVKYIGMDVHKEAISIAVLNSSGRLVMECIIETKASTILQFVHGLSGSLHVTFELILIDKRVAEMLLHDNQGFPP